MALKRHSFLLLAYALLTASGQGQSASITSLDEDFRAMTETNSRLLGIDYTNVVFASEDGGLSFASLSTLSADPLVAYYGMASLGGTTVLAVGTDGLIERSTSEGTTWSSAVTPGSIFGDLKTVSGRVGTPDTWITAGQDGGDGVIFYSADDGANWTETGRFADVGFSGSVWTGSAWLACGINELSFEGVIYRSTDGTSWSALTLPEGTAPLLALAADGTGNVLAVGESGEILHSSNHGQNFSQIGTGLISEDLMAVVSTGTNTFIIGGSSKTLLGVGDSSVSVLREPAGGTPDVEALVLSGGSVIVGGAFSSAIERTIPLALNIAQDAGSYVLTIEQSLSGKAYSLEYSTDLETWTSISGTTLSGTDASLEWIRPAGGTRLFWRAEEF